MPVTITLTILVDADDLDPDDEGRRGARVGTSQERLLARASRTRQTMRDRTTTDGRVRGQPSVLGVEVVRVGENREGDRESARVRPSCSSLVFVPRARARLWGLHMVLL